MKRALAAFLALASSATAALAQDVRPVPIGDVDGDGRADLAVASSVAGRRLMAVSARDGKTLWDFSPRAIYARGIPLVATCSDRDGDLVRDLAAAWIAPADAEVPEHALVAIHSSRTGRVITWTRVPCDVVQHMTLVEGDDYDGDQQRELLLGLEHDEAEFGAVIALSGVDLGARVLARGERALEHFGTAIAPLGDVDGDGVGDLAVGSAGAHPSQRSGAETPGESIAIVSGRTGRRLRSFGGREDAERLGVGSIVGRTFAAATDENAPGSANLWLLATRSHGSSSVLLLVSPRTGDVLARVVVACDAWSAMYAELATAGDFDRDRSSDVILRDPQWDRIVPGSFESDVGLVVVAGVQGVLAEWRGDRARHLFGDGAVAGGDRDRDGSAQVWLVRNGTAGREVVLVSGRDGQPLASSPRLEFASDRPVR